MNNPDNNSNNSDGSLSKLEAANPANYNANSRLLARVLNNVLSQHTDLSEITMRMETLLNGCIDYDNELDYDKIVSILYGNFEAFLEKLDTSDINLIIEIKDILAIFADKYGMKFDLESKNDKAFSLWKEKKRTPTMPYFSLPGDEEQPPSTRIDLPEEIPTSKQEMRNTGAEEPELTGFSDEGGLLNLSDSEGAYAKIMQVRDKLKKNDALAEFREVFEELFYNRFSLGDGQNLWDFLAEGNIISGAINELLTNPEGRFTHFIVYYSELQEKEKFHGDLRKYAFEMLRNDAIGSVQDIIAVHLPNDYYDHISDATDDELPELAIKIADYFREELEEQKSSGEYSFALRRLLFFYTKGVSRVEGMTKSSGADSQMFGLGRWEFLLDEITKVMEKLRGSLPMDERETLNHESVYKTEPGVGVPAFGKPAKRETLAYRGDSGNEKLNDAIQRVLDDTDEEKKPDESYPLIGEDAADLEDTMVRQMPIELPKQRATLKMPAFPPQEVVAEQIPVASPQEPVAEQVHVAPIQEKIAEPMHSPEQKVVQLPVPTLPPKRKPKIDPVPAKKQRVATLVPIAKIKLKKAAKNGGDMASGGVEKNRKKEFEERHKVPDISKPSETKKRNWVRYAIAAVVAASSIAAGIAVSKFAKKDQISSHVAASTTAANSESKLLTSVQSSKIKSAETSAISTSTSLIKAKTPKTAGKGDLDEDLENTAIPEKVKELARGIPGINSIINGELVSDGSGVGGQIFQPFFVGASLEQRAALSQKMAEFNKSSGDYVRAKFGDPEKRKNILEDSEHADHLYAKSVSKYIDLSQLPRPDGSESIAQFKTFKDEMYNLVGVEDVNSVSPNRIMFVSELTIVRELAQIRFPEAFGETGEDPLKGKTGFKHESDTRTYGNFAKKPDQPIKYANSEVCSESAVVEMCQKKIHPGSSRNVDVSFMRKKMAKAEQKKVHTSLLTEAIKKAKRGDIQSTVPDTNDIDGQWELPKNEYASLMTDAITKAKRGDILSATPDTSGFDAGWELPASNVNPGSSEKVRMDHIRAGAARYTESQSQNISRHLRLPQSFIVDRTKGELSMEILERQIQNCGQPKSVVNAVIETLEECENDGLLFIMQRLEGNKSRFILKPEVRIALDKSADNAVKTMSEAA